MPKGKAKKKQKSGAHQCEGCPHFGGVEDNQRQVSCCGGPINKGKFYIRLAPKEGSRCPDRPGSTHPREEGLLHL